MSIPLLVTFVGGTTGQWRVDRISAVIGEALPIVERLAVLEGRDRLPVDQDFGHCVASPAILVTRDVMRLIH